MKKLVANRSCLSRRPKLPDFLEATETDFFRCFLPCRDLYRRAFALQQKCLALIASGIDACGYHPIIGHVCNCSKDPLFRAERQKLMHHENGPYETEYDVPMLPFIFYVPSIDYTRAIFEHVNRRRTFARGQVIGEMSRLLWGLINVGQRVINSIGWGSLEYYVELRQCAKQVADYIFQIGLSEDTRQHFCRAIQRRTGHYQDYLYIFKYVLMEIDFILADFSLHISKQYAVLDELRDRKTMLFGSRLSGRPETIYRSSRRGSAARQFDYCRL
jgi:hypothetical protein